jgi:hypothetical protein
MQAPGSQEAKGGGPPRRLAMVREQFDVISLALDGGRHHCLTAALEHRLVEEGVGNAIRLNSIYRLPTISLLRGLTPDPELATA